MASGEVSDLGEVALLSRNAQRMLFTRPPLTIRRVYSEFKALTDAKGAAAHPSPKAKKERIVKTLTAATGEEAKHLVRMLQARHRVGIQSAIVLGDTMRDFW